MLRTIFTVGLFFTTPLQSCVQYPSGAQSNFDRQNTEISSSTKIDRAIDAWSDTVVKPGYGTMAARLGMSREELVSAFGDPDDAYDYATSCTFSSMHWFPKADSKGNVSGDGVFAFLKDNKVFELRFGKGFSTHDRLVVGNSEPRIDLNIQAPLYRLENSSSKATNNQDLLYFVAKEVGIAYEISDSRKSGRKYLNALYVFDANTEFLPWGCISSSQSFIKIHER